MGIKDQIIEIADEHFNKYGVRSVSMDDIAKYLSISKKTIYQYFKDKDELVSTVTNLHMQKKKEELEDYCQSSVNAIEELSNVTVCLRKNFKEINPSLLFDLQKYHKTAWDLWIKFKNEYVKNSIVNNLKRGIEEGFYRENIDPEVLARFRVEQIQMSFDKTIFPPEKFNMVDIQIQLLDHYIYGILTDDGRRLYKKYLENNLNN